jgi:hypothetical protein
MVIRVPEIFVTATTIQEDLLRVSVQLSSEGSVSQFYVDDVIHYFSELAPN